MNRKFIAGFVLLLIYQSMAFAQLAIANGDGSVFAVKYCYQDTGYVIAGQPGGGVFNGCGVYQQNGLWYFNPVAATSGVTVFPFQCMLNYAVNGQVVNKSILIYKPVKIVPPLRDTATCNGDFVLDAQTLYAGAYHYLWTPAAPLQDADTNYTAGHIDHTQTFVLTAEDVTSGCTGSDTVMVTRNPVPAIQLAQDSFTIMAREPVSLQAGGAAFYYWLPSKWLSNDTIANPVAFPQSPLTYQVIGINAEGCRDTALVYIDIKEQMFVPDAFSPNGDGINDVFRVENIGYQGIEFFRVFNRWGNVVFETTDGTRGWDGRYNHAPADAGHYYYLIRLSMADGIPRTFKGDVLLLR